MAQDNYSTELMKSVEALGQQRWYMLERGANWLQNIIKEIISEGNGCFSCRSAAVGTLVINTRRLKLSVEDIATRWNTMTWITFHKRLTEFEFPRAKCQHRGNAHVDLARRLSDRPCSIDNLGLDISQY